MTYRKLFEALDLDRDELSPVNKAVAASDTTAAVKELAHHIRDRKSPVWYFGWQDEVESTESVPLPEADKILRHEITYGFHGAPDFTETFGEQIDWGANPTEGEHGTHLWNECLNRHFHFDPLVKAYRATGDERYAQALVRDWLDWINNTTRPAGSSGNEVDRPYGCYAWQTLTTGIRLENTWPNALYRCLNSSAFTDEAVAMILVSIREQALHLMRWPTRNNWLTEESMGLFTAGMMFPEFREAPLWRATAIARLYGQLSNEVYPDGAEYELAAGYGNWVVRNFIKLLEHARRNDLMSELPDDLEATMEKMFDYMVSTAMPDGKLPGLNDSYNVDITELLETGYGLFPHREDFLYLASTREKGSLPDRLSCGLPYSGHYVMRSGWEADALYMLVDSGPFGSAHQHEDKLHFVLYAYGRQHVLDPGNYSYDSSRWRNYVLSTPGHNTVMVDGMGQNRRPHKATWTWPKPWAASVPPGNDTVWHSTPDLDYVRGTYDYGYGSDNDRTVTHRRCVFFIKPEYWVIIDTMCPTDDEPHTYESLFHLDTSQALIDEETHAVRTDNPGAANLTIMALNDDTLQRRIVIGQKEPVQGWANNPWRAVPTAVFTKSGSGLVRFVYVLYPTRQNQVVPVTALERLEKDHEDAVEVVFADGRSDVVIFSGRSGAETEHGSFSTDGEAAVVRLRNAGQLVSASVVNGTSLCRGGRAVVPLNK